MINFARHLLPNGSAVLLYVNPKTNERHAEFVGPARTVSATPKKEKAA
ncbi:MULTISPECIES: hypothetical protein [unclassified Oceanobacter]|nr:MULTISPECIES: hypothetical protein [unclassified Oceanobacter]MDP2610053.1 hypothetical protein [Oceanobacter sp. 1_MG-2023]MDP2613311.1 hypothetical protein [Oceanobacter sp. 2_MG-2023]